MTEPRRVAIPVWALLILGLAAQAAATDVRIPLAAGGDPDQAQVRLAAKSGAGLTLRFTAAALALSDQAADGQSFQLIAMPGTASDGPVGQPALPLLTRLVAVPDGMTLAVRQVAPQEKVLAGPFRPWPAQPLHAVDDPRFSRDAALYAGAKQAVAADLVAVGEPGLVRGVRVVPVRFRPVTWQPASGSLKVAATVDVTFDLVPTTDKNSSTTRPIPQSFATMFRNEIIGYTDTGNEMSGPGSYLLIHPMDATVLANLQPLIDWRRRQGYNVIVASTLETGNLTSSIRNYIQNLYDTLEIPLEFVTLVGDANGAVSLPTYTENLSGYGGEGDHQYTLLEGGDVLSDVHLGRLSVTSAAMLATVVGKIVGYETNPYMDSDTEWFTRAGLTGDPSSSGYSCIWVNQWAKSQLLKLNYTKVDTIWGGSFTTQIMNTVNAGESIFTYRGYYGMSGLHTGFIDAMSNNKKLPFALVVTCDTGSFQSDEHCRSEAFLRAPNGGGVASIGTATIGTHTRYNNCMFQGILEGVLNTDDTRVGTGLTIGKWHLYQNYYELEPDEVSIWSTWNNLMGDPATPIWTAVPTVPTVDHPATLSVGANDLPVTVTAGGQPRPGALVTVFRDGQLQVSATTDAGGRVDLPLSGLSNGTYLVTVTGHNLKPYLGTLGVGDLAASVNFAALATDDDDNGASAGNGDGLVNPGEALELGVDLLNSGTAAVAGVTATLTSAHPLVAVNQGSASFGAIDSGATATGLESFVVTVDPAVPGGTVVPLRLSATDGVATWDSRVDLLVSGPMAAVQGAVLGAGALDPGGTTTLTVDLLNAGNLSTAGATATLSSDSRWLSVTDADGTFGATTAGSAMSNAGDTFSISAGLDCYPGHVATLTLDLAFAEGGTASVPVLVTVGTVRDSDPLGPDRHGYYAFDDSDTGYALAPTFNWIEIAPDAGGAGTSVGLQDFDRWQDDVVILDLPFAFTYYGKSFTRMSVCSNGWLTMGGTDQRMYRNWTLPGPGTPDNLIAVYWDDLEIRPSDSGVYWWHDAVNHRLIVEWDNMANAVSGAAETFQVILSDPAYEAGDTGDGIITMNYLTVNQTDAETGYATVGIQNETRDDALLHTYYNLYPAGAARLQANRSIAFRTVIPQAQGQLKGVVTNAANGQPIDGAVINVLGRAMTLASGASGNYQGGLPVGLYDIAVYHPSFAPDTTRAVLIEEGVDTIVDFALTDVAGPAIALQAMPGNTDDTIGPYDVVFTMSDHTGIDAMDFHYTSSSAGGPFALVPVADGPPDTWRVSLPGQPAGTLVQYWLTGADMTGLTSAEPAGAPFDVHSFMVASTDVVYANTMESAGDWTAGAAGDDATSGLWENVDPNGVFDGLTEVAPENDADDPGSLCWITGQDPVGSNQGANDIDGGTTTLLSPVIDVTGYPGLVVSYKRWYTNNTGNSPNEDSWVVQAQDQSGGWVSLENTTASNRSWQPMSFVLADHLTTGGSVAFRFVASDLGAGSVVEAGLDDFVLTSSAQVVDDAVPVVDLLGPNGGESLVQGATVAVTWTHSDDTGVVDVEIRLSDDGGASYGEVLAGGPFNGSWSWLVPSLPGSTYRIKVVCRDAAGNATEAASAADFAIGGPTAVGDLPANRLLLAQNAPNPFNPRTKISFALPVRQEVTLAVYNVEGRLVRTLVQGPRDAGPHTVVWDGTGDQGAPTASGLYFYRLVTADGTLTRKMTLLK